MNSINFHPGLSENERIRYARHLNIQEVGEEGQLKLKSASVLIAGAGGLGSASAIYLAAAGIGRIGIIDSDQIDLSNLQRQILHDSMNIGIPKVISAQKKLSALNPEVQVDALHKRITNKNVNEIIKNYMFVVDATDNFKTRYMLNEICVKQQKPFIYGAVYQFFGQMSVFYSAKGPCFRCVFQKIPSVQFSKANQGIGVVSMVPGTIGTLQAIEVLKLILGIGNPSIGRLVLFDGLEMRFQEIRTRKNSACPTCGKHQI